MIILIDAEKARDKIQHPFAIKTPSKLGTERNFLKLTKGIYEKPTTNNIFNGKRLNAFSVRSEIRQGYPFFSLLLNIILEGLARAGNKNKEEASRLASKEEVKLSLQMTGS